MGSKTKFYANIEVMHDEVTGSCILTSVNFPNGKKIRFVVDCGLYQETDYEELNRTLKFDASNLDFVLVTHNHVDHIGRLPLLVRNGYDKKIYMSEITSRIITPALTDSYKVLNQKCKSEGKKPIYSTQNVSEVLEQRKGIEFNTPFKVDENVTVTFLKNGHLVGAALILVQISYKENGGFYQYEDINLLFTGDYKKENVFFDVEDIPEWIKTLPLTIIQESTYGDTETKDIKYSFVENIQTAADLGKEILIPAFSQGRFQEIMLVLKNMQEEGILSCDIPIYLDGNLAQKYTRLFLKGNLGIKQECKDFVPESSIFVDDSFRNRILSDQDTKIILSSSGMASYGPARTYLPVLLSRKHAVIQFTGYTAEGTLGRKILDCENQTTVCVGGQEIVKRAEVFTTSEFSGHAKVDEMIEFLSGFQNIKLILLNHGVTETKIEFADRILKSQEVNAKCVEILDRNYFFRVDAYGLVKKINA